MKNGYVLVAPDDGSSEAYKSTVSINGDNSQTSETSFSVDKPDQLKDPDYLLHKHGYDPRFYNLISAKHSTWEQGTKTGKKQLYSSKISVKPKSYTPSKEDILSVFDNLDNFKFKPVVEYTDDYLNGDKLLLINVADLHYNLKSTYLTTGEEYNCEIAEQLLTKVINDIVSRTKNYTFEKIIFTIGGDFLNTDNINNTTTHGTPQDVATNFYEAFNGVVKLIIKSIDTLASIAPVDVVHVVANHDMETSYAIAHLIDAWYRNDDRVTVNTTPEIRKYVVYGNTLFMFAHDGDSKKLPKLIPDEAREYWSDINFTEVFLQHLHTETILMEDNNLRIQRLPTISAKSRWSSEKGYNSKRQFKSFIYDRVDGLTDVLYSSI